MSDGRLLVARENSATVTILSSQCRAERAVRLQIPWFKPWQFMSIDPIQVSGIPTSIVEVRVRTDGLALVLLRRTRPNAKLSSGAAVRSGRPVERASVPVRVADYMEWRLVVAALADGAILADLLLPDGFPSLVDGERVAMVQETASGRVIRILRVTRGR